MSGSAGFVTALGGILGDFRLVRQVGRGGMAVVYEAEQISLRRRVALKVLPVASLLDERQVQRFRNEAAAAAGLQHPSIVPVFSVGCERGVHYLAMQFIDGRTLADAISEARVDHGLETPESPNAATAVFRGDDFSEGAAPIPRSVDLLDDTVVRPLFATPHPASAGDTTSTPEEMSSTDEAAADHIDEASSDASWPIFFDADHHQPGRERFQAAARLIRRAAEALDYAHGLGVVHRDVKPSNLLLDGEGNIWVADFGLAHLEGSGSLTMTGDLMGTLRYMSPEQATGRRDLVDHRSDVYSLGLTFYELLTLTPAFAEGDRAGVLRRVIEAEPPRPRRVDPSIPIDLENVVLKATAKEPASRYQTAREFAEDLRRYLDDEPVRARRPSLSDQLSRWSKRHRVTTFAAAIALIAITLVSGVSAALVAGAYRHASSAWLDAEASARREVDQARLARSEAEKATANEALAREAASRATQSEALAKRRLSQSERSFGSAIHAVDQMLSRVGASRLIDTPGLSHVRRDLLADARGFYQRLLADDPENFELRQRLAINHIATGKLNRDDGQHRHAMDEFRSAFRLFEELSESYPANIRPQLGLARAHYHAQDVDSLSRAERLEYSRRAVDAYEQLIARDPANPQIRPELARACIAFAMQLLQNQQPADAVAAAEQAERLVRRGLDIHRTVPDAAKSYIHFPDLRNLIGSGSTRDFNAAVSHAMALICERKGQIDEAEQHFTACIDRDREVLDKELAGARYRMLLIGALDDYASMLRNCGRRPEGAAVSREADRFRIKLSNDFPDEERYRGLAYAAADRLAKFRLSRQKSAPPEEILQQLEEGLERFPADLVDSAMRIDVLSELKRWNDVAAEYRRMTEVRDHQEGHLRLAAVFADELHDHQSAAEEFRRALEIAPWQPSIVQSIAAAEFYAGDYQASLEAIGRAIELSPGDISILNAIPLDALVACQDSEYLRKYTALIDSLVVANRSRTDAFVLRSRMLEMLGNFARAEDDLRLAAEMWPQDEAHRDDATQIVETLFDGVARAKASSLTNAEPYADAAWRLVDRMQSTSGIDSTGLYLIALHRAECGDIASYRNTCRTLADRFLKGAGDEAAYLAGFAHVLAPDAADDYAAITASADRLKGGRAITLRGAIEFRAGRPGEALRALSGIDGSSDARFSSSYASYFNAMAHAKLGHHATATTLLVSANTQAEEELADRSTPLLHTATLRLLRREAESVVEPQVASTESESVASVASGRYIDAR